jgi:hypothetical protein
MTVLVRATQNLANRMDPILAAMVSKHAMNMLFVYLMVRFYCFCKEAQGQGGPDTLEGTAPARQGRAVT